MSEAWLPVVGFEGFYEVSDLGRVRSLARRIATTAGRGGAKLYKRRERILKPTYRKGYAGVSLAKDNNQKITRVNRLVLTTFVGEPGSSVMQACHKDGNTLNNRLYNLYWGTPQQNNDDRITHGTVLRGDNHPTRKLSGADVLEVRKLLAAGNIQQDVALMFDVNQTAISAINTRRTWKHL
jgi:hypothetical protein